MNLTLMEKENPMIECRSLPCWICVTALLALGLVTPRVASAHTRSIKIQPARSGTVTWATTSPVANGVLDANGKITVDDNAWLDLTFEARDAKGNRLLSQTVDAGSSVDLVGAPPFTVFLGNASGVRVQYLGKIQALSQAKKGLFARFIVGGGDQ